MRLLLPLLLAFSAAVAATSLAETPPSGATGPTADSSLLDPIRTLIRDGRFPEAEREARALLSELEETGASKSMERASVIELLVDAMICQGKAEDPDCLALAERALRIKESTLASGHRDLARSHRTLGQIYEERGDYAEARRHLEHALEISREAYGENDPRTVIDTRMLATLYSEMGLYAEARSMFEQALRIIKSDPSKTHPDLVPLQYHLATVLRKLGEYDEAERLYRRAISTAEEAHKTNHPQLAYLFNGLANLLDERGEYTEAREAYERAIELGEASLGPDHPVIASFWNNLGYLLKNIGDYAEAEEAYKRALALHTKARGIKHRYTASTMANLAALYQRVGRYEESESLYQESLKTREEILGHHHTVVATSLNDLANLYLEVGQPARARALIERALEIMEKRFGHEHPDTGEVLFALARALDESGDRQAAGLVDADALDVLQATLGPEHPRIAPLLLHLGWLSARTGDRSKAMGLALRAEAISRDHVRLMASALPERQALRYSSVRTGGLDLALTLTSDELDEAEPSDTWDALIRSRALVLDAMADRHRTLRYEDEEISRPAGDYALASKRLADLLVEGPDPENPGQWRERLHESREAREESERALAEASSSFRQDLSRRAVGLTEVRASLPESSALVAYVRYDRWFERDASSQQRPPEVTSNTLILGSRGIVPSYLAFVQREDATEPSVVPLGAAESIDQLVAEWSTATSLSVPPVNSGQDAVRSFRAAGDDLRSAIWDPLAAHLGGARTVFVVPDGSLHRVSLAALPVGSERYLVEEEVLIHYLSAERDLVAASRPVESGRGLLALGGPSFDGGLPSPEAARGRPASSSGSPTIAPVAFALNRDAKVHLAGITFEPLPASAAEARAIANLWSQATGTETIEDPTRNLAGQGLLGPEVNSALLLTGPDATEAAVKKLARGRRILHLATHGFFLRADVLAQPTKMTSRGIGGVTPAVDMPPPALATNPLLLSGLALAHANRRDERASDEEDGMLTAEEIVALDLSGVEWAVLSACDTGIGRVESGEGVFGLRRSFQIAGSQTLIMSLWPVEDEAARRWMEALYRARLIEKLTTVESIHQACTEVLQWRRSRHESDHPFFWAGFVASGGWQ